ncbi:hypothetical protein [Hydrogenophaga laconesensis]|uniref:hypothetical protein n=1 Tax=Hydrogenophaga laconesensis TaxID=1805971 RepID=UPI00286C6FEC|nr:hypothetical protein [Hydrogenophaga laconesensis]
MSPPAFNPFGPDIGDVAEHGEPLLAGNRFDLFEHADEVRVAQVAMFERALVKAILAATERGWTCRCWCRVACGATGGGSAARRTPALDGACTRGIASAPSHPTA